MKKHIYYAILHVLTVLTSIIFVTTTIGFNLPLMLILSGIGTGIFVDNFGWAGALYFWIAAAICCMLVLIPVYRKGV